jgi:hypothetical protein
MKQNLNNKWNSRLMNTWVCKEVSSAGKTANLEINKAGLMAARGAFDPN